MPFTLFHSRFPEIAERETRTIMVLRDSTQGLPVDQYGLLELYCDEPGCDCRRVFFSVVSRLRREPVAVIAYGWERPEYYAKWMGDDDPQMLKQLCGPVLNLGSPQSELAPAILEMVKDTALQDSAYIDRLKTHYKLFRDKIDKPRAAPTSKKRRKRRKSRA
jgi:hypothetical protein